MDWKERALTVLGLSRSGAAVARYVAKRGGKVFLSDSAPATPANEILRQELNELGVTIEMGGHGSRCFDHANDIVVSPGIPPTNETMQQLKLSEKNIISEVEFAYLQAPTIPIVAITGTNGKSTTTTLVSHILTTAGLRAPACGNIGIPITDILNESPVNQPVACDVLVAELSSFQITFSPTLKTKVGILTNFKADHLDWHGSLEGYRDAKLALFSGDRAPEWSILPADDPIGTMAADLTPNSILWFSRHESSVQQYSDKTYIDFDGNFVIETAKKGKVTLLNRRDLYIIGAHNEENVLAATAAAYLMDVSTTHIISACKSFKGLEHRLEQLDPVGPNQVVFFNDSKATNTDAAISALKAFENKPVILIAGGYDKMTPLEEFSVLAQKTCKTIILIGAAKERFAGALKEAGAVDIQFSETLESAVQLALNLSKGEPVLFSPACSSFDMFKNFEERGRIFKQAVEALRHENASSASPMRVG